MKKSIYIFGIILLALFGLLELTSAKTYKGMSFHRGGKDTADSPIKFDGVYYKNGIMKAGGHQNSNYTYLRFYPDGTVVVKISASKPEQIARYIGKQKNEGKGKYKVKNDEISFGMRQINEYQAYEGKVMGDTLQLMTTASSTGFSVADNYFYIPVEFKEK